MDIEVVESEIHHIEELVSEKTDEIDVPEVSSIPVKPTVEFESAEIDFVKLENNSILEEVKEEIAVSEIAPTLIEVEPIIEEEKIEPNPINLAENEVEETIISTENSEDLIEEATTKEVTSIDENSFESLSEEVIPEIKEKLDIGKPITFSQNEKHSFQEWLQLASFKPIERIEVKKETLSIQNSVQKEEKKHENSSNKLKKLEIIDKFIEANPKITPAKELIDLPSKPIETSDTTHLMTETLARVYLEQKKYSKAIQAYEILILKYPEKSIFFADRIKDIKILQQNNQ
jgi:hypothetical protein